MNPEELAKLSQQLEGSLHTDDLTRTIYATDASVYRKIPLAVAYPKNALDIQKIIRFASKYHVPIIPRTAGTSLAGQVVGEGIIVDVSKHLNSIIEIDAVNKTVFVEPGVVRDELNYHLKEFGLFFAPNTSTTNRCMIGGMVGNNSSGTTSIRYGVTRDKILELDCLLADGSEVSFKNLNPIEFQQKTKLKTLEGKLYQSIFNELSSDAVQNQIKTHFPKPEIHRRNTGYAVDALLENAVFGDSEKPFNFSKLMAGSEGTLAFTTKIKLQLDDLPPANNIMVVSHFDSIEKSMNAVLVAMKHRLYSCEMLDKVILDCTKNNPIQLKNRFFISGDPKAIMMFEVASHTPEDAEIQAENLLSALKQSGFSYADVTLKGNEINQAIELRKAGLGLLGNMIGDRKAVACIEDTAVSLKDLPAYIKEFSGLMDRFGQDAVYYAHAGAGELHLRPILDLKKSGDVRLFREITQAVADLVQKYKGSMSGEHGDGIVRAEFIPQMVGKANYELFLRIKKTFDPEGIFNPGKIVNAWPMDESLRYEKDAVTPEIETLLDFSDSLGILRAAEKCNGAGDCRKLPESGGTMCPSYRATRLEKDTTRARANTLREILTHNTKVNRFDSEQLKEVFDLCLSCKGCVGECPSNVDAASLKAEFLYQYQKSNGVPLRSKIFAYNNSFNRLGSKFSSVTNFLFTNKLTAGVLKAMTGVASKRTLPLLSKISLEKWVRKSTSKPNDSKLKSVYFFIDEFTNYLDTSVGIDAIELLQGLGYDIQFIKHAESGRAFISKGLLHQAKRFANVNVSVFKNLINENTPLIGIEPSAILTFRDEYLRLASDKNAAKKIAENTYLIEEFLQKEMKAGNISKSKFQRDKKIIKIHGHCHQKALSGIEPTFFVLNYPENYTVTIIPSGCCGMAGSFGYEKEHYNLSMQIGEQTLFPAVRKAEPDTIIAAAGTSCRHQIMDGTKREALHPATILRQALIR